MHKKVNIAYYLPYDIHIVEALKALPVPLVTFDNHEVYFDQDKRYETIYEHIANKSHHLHLVDIARIPLILRDKDSLKLDKNGKGFRTYIGLRGKKNEPKKYILITTRVKQNNKESVVSLFPIKLNY